MKHLEKTFKTVKSILILGLLLIGLLVSNNANAQITTGTMTSANQINLNPVTNWNSGSINANSLTPQTGNNKVWNGVRFLPGKYEVTLQIQNLRPNRSDTRSIRVIVKGLYRGLSDSNKRNDEVIIVRSNNKGATNVTTFTGEVIIRNYNSKSSQNAVNYGQVKIRVFKGDVNTNVKFRITLRRISTDTAGWDSKTIVRGNKRTTRGLIGNVSPIVNTIIHTKYKSKTNDMKVKITKRKGRAKTMVKVYTSNSLTGNKTNHTNFEFSNSRQINVTEEIDIIDVKDKFIHVEIDNQSATLEFKYRIFIYEKYVH